jgi:benzil reductase ((S)-benzoin forming)
MTLVSSDRVALVTGTTSGIGEAVARALVGRGWHVLGVARRPATIDNAAYEHVPVDLHDPDALVRSLEGRLTTILGDRRWRRVGLVNNAADPALLGPITHLDARRLPEVFAANVFAPMWLMGAFVRLTTPSTILRIVNVSSGAAVRGIPGLAGYGCAKAALRMAGMVLAAELQDPSDVKQRDRPISILSYEPGVVDTPMQNFARSQSAAVLPSREMFVQFAAESRLVPPTAPAGEIADFLESDRRERFAERRFGS